MPKGSEVPEWALVKMREEFIYWYPVDLRVSGRDLIQVCKPTFDSSMPTLNPRPSTLHSNIPQNLDPPSFKS